MEGLGGEEGKERVVSLWPRLVMLALRVLGSLPRIMCEPSRDFMEKLEVLATSLWHREPHPHFSWSCGPFWLEITTHPFG